jgi:hypothetical protein
VKKAKRVRRVHTADQLRAALRREIRESGLSQAAFARTKLRASPESLSLILASGRGLSRKAQRYLGVKREIIYRDARE